jgi:hypothetical protein
MRLLTSSIALLVATGGALTLPVAAHADTGGSQLYYLGSSNHMWSAPAADPGHRRRIPRPLETDGPLYPLGIVPSPKENRLAMTLHRGQVGQRIYVTGPQGQHPVLVARFDNDPNAGLGTAIDDVSWQGQHRLYFTVVTETSMVIDTVRVPAHGTPGPVREIPNSSGLFGLTVDPKSNRLAAVDTFGKACSGSGPLTKISGHIVVLHLDTHQRRPLATLKAPTPEECALPHHLAWSPDGSQIAFAGRAFTKGNPKVEINVVKTVATGPHQSHQPHAITPARRKLAVYASPAWQSAHSLWFVASEDFYSISLMHGHTAPPHRQTHNPSALKFSVSFG